MANLNLNLLMTGAGAPGAAGIIQCLRADQSIKIIGADMDPNAYGKHLTDSFYTLPKATDPLFGERINQICDKEGVQFILPLVTKELSYFAKVKETFLAKGIQVAVNPPEILEIANNKGKLYQQLTSLGLPLPPFEIVTDFDSFQKVVNNFQNQKIVFKPCVSNGSRGLRIIDDQLNNQDLLFNLKPGHPYITKKQALEILTDIDFPPLLVSGYLPGIEYSVDCLCDSGEMLLCLPRKRTKIQNGISTAGVFHQHLGIIKQCQKIIEHLRLDGNIGIQFKEDKNGVPMLLEINPRVQGTMVSTLGAGVNMVLEMLLNKLKIFRDYPSINKNIKWNTAFVRHWTEVYYQT